MLQLKLFFVGLISCIITSGIWKVYTTKSVDQLHWHWKFFGKLYILIVLIYVIFMLLCLITGICDLISNYRICKI